MFNTFFDDNFIFCNISFNKYHYTDSRDGSKFNYIGYMLKGRCKIVCSYNTIEVETGEYFFIPQNLQYESFWFGNDEILFISLGFNNLPCEESQSFLLQKFDYDTETATKIKHLQLGSPITASTLSDFYDILSVLLSTMRSVPKNKEQKLIDKIKKYIEQNPLNPVSKICSDCYISKSYMYYIFKKNMLMTPNDYRYLICCRIAEKLLCTTDKKIDDIATELNFSSTSYFRKILKKYTGKTPKEIQKSSIV